MNATTPLAMTVSFVHCTPVELRWRFRRQEHTEAVTRNRPGSLRVDLNDRVEQIRFDLVYPSNP